MTRSLGVKVPSSAAEETRRRLRAEGRLRDDLRIRSEGPSILLPVLAPAKGSADSEGLVSAEFEPVGPARLPSRYQDLVECPPETRDRLPRAFDVVGDIVLIRIPPELEALAPAIGQALLDFVPNARIAGRDLGVHGTERRRALVRLAGAGGWRTTHRENGVTIHVDVERAYFSPRLAREHAVVAGSVGPGEIVFDLCCGVGPFSLQIARHERAKRIVAVDQNPDAVALLRDSARRAKGGARIEPHEADVAAFLSSAGTADRAILNLPHGGIKYLAPMSAVVRPGGVIHYYEVVPRNALERRRMELVEEAGGPSRWVAEDPRVVHPYSPSSDLVAFTLAASGGP